MRRLWTCAPLALFLAASVAVCSQPADAYSLVDGNLGVDIYTTVQYPTSSYEFTYPADHADVPFKTTNDHRIELTNLNSSAESFGYRFKSEMRRYSYANQDDVGAGSPVYNSGHPNYITWSAAGMDTLVIRSGVAIDTSSPMLPGNYEAYSRITVDTQGGSQTTAEESGFFPYSVYED